MSCLPQTEEPSLRLPSSGLCGLMIQAWLEFFCAISISVCFRFRQRHGMLLTGILHRTAEETMKELKKLGIL